MSSNGNNSADRHEHTLPMRPRPKSTPIARPVFGDPFTQSIPSRFRFRFPGHKEVIELEAAPYLVIGRKSSLEDLEVALDLSPLDGRALGVSRFHAMILCIGTSVTIKDLSSLNGTAINNEALEPSVEYRLYSGDAISVSRLTMIIEFIDD